MSPDIARSNPPSGDDASASSPALVRRRAFSWRSHWRAVVGCAACIAYPFLVYWGVAQPKAWLGPLFFLPPLCVNLGLAWYFGRSLAPGREALITHFARVIEGNLESPVVGYTRRLTWVWVAFFLAMAAVSALLAMSGAHWAWVWFTAVGNYLCVVAMFVIEYGYRRWRFPHNDHVSLLQQIMRMRAALRDRGR